jgi:hypothetical protein
MIHCAGFQKYREIPALDLRRAEDFGFEREVHRTECSLQ